MLAKSGPDRTEQRRLLTCPKGIDIQESRWTEAADKGDRSKAVRG